MTCTTQKKLFYFVAHLLLHLLCSKLFICSTAWATQSPTSMKEEAEDTSLATFEEPHDASAPRAKYRGEPGHETTLPFVANGVEFRLMTNDFAGGTDKYVSGASTIVVRRGLGDNFGLALGGSWSAITPERGAYSSGRLRERQRQQKGLFADWLNSSAAIAYLSDPLADFGRMRFGLRSSYQLGHVGDHGMKELHSRLHRTLQNEYRWLSYNEQPYGQTRGYQIEGVMEFGAFLLPGPSHRHLPVTCDLSLGRKNSILLVENFSAFTCSASSKDFYSVSEQRLELFVAKPISSMFFPDLRPYRWEAAYGVKVFNHWIPTLRWVSSYVLSDQKRQLFVDLLNFSAEF